MKQKLVAAIYARKSVILKKGDTLNIQEDKCRENLKLRYKYDYDLTIKCFTDEKTGKDMDREEMQSMIEQIKEGKVQVVCAYKLDRFGRNAIELVNFIELLKKYNVKLHCVDDQINYDPKTRTVKIHEINVRLQMNTNSIKIRSTCPRKKMTPSKIIEKASDNSFSLAINSIFHIFLLIKNRYIIINLQILMVNSTYKIMSLHKQQTELRNFPQYA